MQKSKVVIDINNSPPFPIPPPPPPPHTHTIKKSLEFGTRKKLKYPKKKVSGTTCLGGETTRVAGAAHEHVFITWDYRNHKHDFVTWENG